LLVTKSLFFSAGLLGIEVLFFIAANEAFIRYDAGEVLMPFNTQRIREVLLAVSFSFVCSLR